LSWLFKDPRLDKYKFEEKVAGIDGIVTTGQRFQSYFDLIRLWAGWNFEFRFLLDLYLNLYGHIDLEFMDWFDLDFSSLFPEIMGCAKYDVSKFAECVYDPQITGRDMENLSWDLTYHTTDHNSLETKLGDKTLRNFIDGLRTVLMPKGIPDYFFDVLEQCVAVAEGKLQRVAYWDVAVWDGNVWVDEDKVEVRDIGDWLSKLLNESIWVFEGWWDWMRWDYGRWMDDDVVERVRVDPEWINKIGEYLDGKIKAFHETIEPVYSTVRRLERKDRIAWEGGGWIPQMGYFRAIVKKFLQRYGLSGIQYAGYMTFALELARVTVTPKRKWKSWRTVLTEEDLVEKYVNQGLNRDLLNGIRRLI